jgi:hypothetical protein
MTSKILLTPRVVGCVGVAMLQQANNNVLLVPTTNNMGVLVIFISEIFYFNIFFLILCL